MSKRARLSSAATVYVRPRQRRIQQVYLTMTPSTSALSPDLATARSGRAWFLEWESALLVAMVLGIFATRLTDLSIRGEESRRGRIAWEMVDTGDYLVPRVQGKPRLSRPPVHYWSIAAAGIAWGAVDPVAVRLPSLLATLLTVLLVYGYSRTFLSRLGAFAAATAYMTMGQVLELGRLGETEAVFTLLMSGSLLVWHWGFARRWPATVTWTLAYFLAGLATLTKGPQGPVYFVGGVGAWLLVTRQWRHLLTRAHAAGIAVGLLTVFAWQVPFMLTLGFGETSFTYTSEVGKRFGDTRLVTILKHLATCPAEILFGCLMPWSLLLFAYADRRFRAVIGGAKPHVLFLVSCIVVAFPTVWLPPESRSRYFMPLYPCFAPLVGLVVERAFQAARDAEWAKVWTRYAVGFAAVMAAAGVGLAGISLLDPGSRVAQPRVFAAAYLGAALAAAAVTLRAARMRTPAWGRTALVAMAAFTGLTYTGAVINAQIKTSEDAAGAVARIRQQLPPGAELISFDITSHVFTFHLGERVRHVPWPKTADEVPPEVEYFCFDVYDGEMPELPIAWEQLGRISCERNRTKTPDWEVVVGRRIPGGAGEGTPIRSARTIPTDRL